MTDPESNKPPRRERYQGKNPRAFEQKYKEHNPGRYPADVAKVIAAGKTPAGMHRPIMVREILEVLTPQPGDSVLDCTLGYGGHATALLAAVQPHGRLIGLDADPLELPKTEARLRGLGYPDESIVVQRTNFAGIAPIVGTHAPNGLQVILADLGLSSMQIDDPARGFSFKADGPLDMRMNPNRGQSAAKLLSNVDAVGLSRLLEENADEPQAERVSRAILKSQDRSPIETTFQLVAIVRAAIESQNQVGKEEATDTVRRVFQALRIAVNDEFSALDTLLKQVPSCLARGGRIAIMAFHSGEDRRIKNAFKLGFQNGIYSSIAHEIIRPSMQEQRDNPRCTSAKLRFAIRS
jgi:16S rRNA (cytosine1402-N4)-methyltransferase